VRVRCNRVRLAAYDADARVALTTAPRVPTAVHLGGTALPGASDVAALGS
jgi:hypothetical protein